MISGLGLGRVVVYTPARGLDDETMLSDANYKMLPAVQGRVARIDSLDHGLVTLALDVPPAATKGWAMGMTYFAMARPYDASGEPGTWRFPARIP